MIDERRARQLAAKAIQGGDDASFGPTTELRQGWFFPRQPVLIGSSGVIVNKATGRVLQLGSAFPIDRDLAMYDRGYQFERYDLVILAIRDLDATRRAVGQLPLYIVKPKYEHGEVWRIRKTMTDLERWKRLEELPCIFAAMSLYFHLEVLEEARSESWFDFEALEYRPGSES